MNISRGLSAFTICSFLSLAQPAGAQNLLDEDQKYKPPGSWSTEQPTTQTPPVTPPPQQTYPSTPQTQVQQTYPANPPVQVQGVPATPVTREVPGQRMYGMPNQQFQMGYIPPGSVLLTTTSALDGFRVVNYKGLVQGTVVRRPSWGQNMSAGFQKAFGATEIDAYREMCEQARMKACENLMQRTKVMGANAVLNLKFDTETYWIDKDRWVTEVVCYGTAVVVEPAAR